MLKKTRDVLEAFSYAVLIIGFALDQLSTRFGLLFPHLFREANQLAVWLMANKLWLLFDVCMVLPSIIIPYYLIRKKPKLVATLTYPLTLGILKCAVGIRNYIFVFGTLMGR